jgi:hypothetical protein
MSTASSIFLRSRELWHTGQARTMMQQSSIQSCCRTYAQAAIPAFRCLSPQIYVSSCDSLNISCGLLWNGDWCQCKAESPILAFLLVGQCKPSVIRFWLVSPCRFLLQSWLIAWATTYKLILSFVVWVRHKSQSSHSCLRTARNYHPETTKSCILILRTVIVIGSESNIGLFRVIFLGSFCSSIRIQKQSVRPQSWCRFLNQMWGRVFNPGIVIYP